MNKKNKASKLISTATGLIIIIAVILCSPLFGYGRGLASKEQRDAAKAAEPGFSTGYTAVPQAAAAATPRPTAQPTPAPGANEWELDRMDAAVSAARTGSHTGTDASSVTIRSCSAAGSAGGSACAAGVEPGRSCGRRRRVWRVV